MGGNIDGSSLLVSGSGRLGGVARCWVLKGQPRAGSSVPGSGPKATSPALVGLVAFFGVWGSVGCL